MYVVAPYNPPFDIRTDSYLTLSGPDAVGESFLRLYGIGQDGKDVDINFNPYLDGNGTL